MGLAPILICKGREKEMTPMNNSSLLAILLLLTRTTLWTRISAQGLGLALLSTAIE